MNKQPWDLSLRVACEEAKLIEFKHHKWGFLITVKVCDANCWLTSVRARVLHYCSRARVCLMNIEKE